MQKLSPTAVLKHYIYDEKKGKEEKRRVKEVVSCFPFSTPISSEETTP